MKFTKIKIKHISFIDTLRVVEQDFEDKNGLFQHIPGQPDGGEKKPDPKKPATPTVNRGGGKPGEKSILDKAKEVGSDVLDGAVKQVDNVKTNIENKVKGQSQTQKDVAQKQVDAAEKTKEGTIEGQRLAKEGTIEGQRLAKEGTIEGQRLAKEGTIEGQRLAKEGTITASAIQSRASQVSAALGALANLITNSDAVKEIEDSKALAKSLTDPKIARKAKHYMRSSIVDALDDVGLMPGYEVKLSQADSKNTGGKNVLFVPSSSEIQVSNMVFARDGKGLDTDEFSGFVISDAAKGLAETNKKLLLEEKANKLKTAKAATVAATTSAGTAPTESVSAAEPSVLRTETDSKITGVFAAGAYIMNVPEADLNKVYRRVNPKEKDGYDYYTLNNGKEVSVDRKDIFVKPSKVGAPTLRNGAALSNIFTQYTEEIDKFYFEDTSSTKVLTAYNNNRSAGLHSHAAMGMAELKGEEGGGFIQKLFKMLEMWSRLKSEGQAPGNFIGYLAKIFGVDKFLGGITGKQGGHQDPHQNAANNLVQAHTEIQNIMHGSTHVALNSSQDIETTITLKQADAQKILELSKKLGIGTDKLISGALDPLLGTDAKGAAALKEVQAGVTTLISTPATAEVPLNNTDLKDKLSAVVITKKEQEIIAGKDEDKKKILGMLADGKIDVVERHILAIPLAADYDKTDEVSNAAIKQNYGTKVNPELLVQALEGNKIDKRKAVLSM
jgi:hypothetical protein